jgi:hypothetical protein
MLLTSVFWIYHNLPPFVLSFLFLVGERKKKGNETHIAVQMVIDCDLSFSFIK